MLDFTQLVTIKSNMQTELDNLNNGPLTEEKLAYADRLISAGETCDRG